jgi:hypothetical protein
MNILKNYKSYIYSIIFGLIVILTITLSLPVLAQFTPTQNGYLNRNELLKNPDAEQGVAGWINSGGVVSSVTTDYFSGTRSFEIVLTADTLSFCQSVATSVLMRNALLSPTCRIKTTNATIQICNNIDGVNSNCNTVDDSGLWEKSSSISDFLTGATSSGLCIISTGAITDTIKVDNCELDVNELPAAGIIGNVLTSSGTEWASAPLPIFIESLNFLTTTQQYFATSTTGTNFTISSSVDTHTFNLPTASAVNTGKLSNTDWSTFNSKEPAITTLPVSKGGTGANTLTLNNVILGNGTSAVQFVAPSTSGKSLVSDGTTWSSGYVDYSDLLNTPLNVSDFFNDANYVVGPVDLTSDVTGILPRANGGTGLSAAGTIGNVLTSDGTDWISSPAVGGSVNLFNSSDLTLTAGDQIALSVVSGDVIQKWLVKSNSGAITMSTTPFLGVVADGTEIQIIGTSDTDTVELTNNDIAGGCILNGNAILQRFWFITVVYNATLDRYIEKSRSF